MNFREESNINEKSPLKSSIYKEVICDGLIITKVNRKNITECHIFLSENNSNDQYKLVLKLLEYLDERKLKITSQDIFGTNEFYNSLCIAFERTYKEITWPITFLRSSQKNKIFNGAFFWATSCNFIRPVIIDKKIIGTIFNDDNLEYLKLGGIETENHTDIESNLSKNIFDKIEYALISAGMDWSNIIRTWFFNRDIIAWYPDFNKIRNTYYLKRKMFDRFVPASTGIGTRQNINPLSNAGILAVKPKNKSTEILEVSSPLQCSAVSYGSAFSRAVEIIEDDLKRLFISGTASIDQNGNTIFADDTNAQIGHTMNVVKAILHSSGMDWININRAIIYFKNISEYNQFEFYLRQNKIADFPFIIYECDICRNDLLFEIELDAIKLI